MPWTKIWINTFLKVGAHAKRIDTTFFPGWIILYSGKVWSLYLRRKKFFLNFYDDNTEKVKQTVFEIVVLASERYGLTHFGYKFEFKACQCYNQNKITESFTKTTSSRGRKKMIYNVGEDITFIKGRRTEGSVWGPDLSHVPPSISPHVRELDLQFLR